MRVKRGRTKCSVSECERRYEGKHKGYPYCKKHLYNIKKYCNPLHSDAKRLLRQILIENEIIGTCKSPKCKRKTYAKGLCKKHYMRKFRTGVTHLIDRKEVTTCLVFDCNEKHYDEGYCKKHFTINRNTGTPFISKKLGFCAVKDCEGVYWAKELCKKHYENWRYHLKYHGLI